MSIAPDNDPVDSAPTDDPVTSATLFTASAFSAATNPPT